MIQNLPLLIGENDARNAVIEKLMREEVDTATALAELGRFWKIKIHFSRPVQIISRGRYKKTSEHTFTGFFKSRNGVLCYNKGPRRGYPFSYINEIVSIEPLPDRKKKEFSGLEDFKKRFDTFFISEKEIEGLWNQKSSQHGGKYLPSDFHRIGPAGRRVLDRFLINFKGIGNDPGPGYHKSPHGEYLVYSEEYHSYHRLGRDIKISHQTNVDFVFYSSEYHGMLNGRYGLVANRKEFLWLEDD